MGRGTSMGIRSTLDDEGRANQSKASKAESQAQKAEGEARHEQSIYAQTGKTLDELNAEIDAKKKGNPHLTQGMRGETGGGGRDDKL